MDMLESYYEKQATEYEGRPLVSKAWCPGCKKYKLLERFKRFLTAGEARARGYPLHPKHEVETRQCNLCRPARTTPRAKQTNTQLRKSVERGDIPEYVAQKLIAERAEMALPAMREGAKTRLENSCRREWEALIDALALEVQAVHMQMYHATRQKPQQLAVATFCDEYMGVLKNVRSQLKLQARRAKLRPQFKAWQEAVREYDLNIVRASWEAVSRTKRRGGIRMPKLFNEELGISPVSSVRPYVPPKVVFKPGVLKEDWSDLVDMGAPIPEPPPPAPEKPTTDWSAIPWEDM